MLIDGHIVTHDTLVARAEKWLKQQVRGHLELIYEGLPD